MSLAHAVLSCERLVGELRRTQDGPVEAACFEYALHGGGVSHHAWEKQAAEEVGRGHNRILEEKGRGYDHDAPDAGSLHRGCQGGTEVAEQVRVLLRDGH